MVWKLELKAILSQNSIISNGGLSNTLYTSATLENLS